MKNTTVEVKINNGDKSVAIAKAVDVTSCDNVKSAGEIVSTNKTVETAKEVDITSGHNAEG